MGTAIIVGQIPDANLIGHILAYVDKSYDTKDSKVSGFLGRLMGKPNASDHAQKLVGPWKNNTNPSQVIDTLNLASIDFFLDHMAQLDGLKDSAEAIDKCRWRNLPYYIHSIWLPFKEVKADPVVVEVSGWPFQIGSALGLLRDLTEIATKSDKGLGAKPELFDLMMTHPKDFLKAANDGFSLDETLRWVWFAYKAGAELAVSKNLPLWQAG